MLSKNTKDSFYFLLTAFFSYILIQYFISAAVVSTSWSLAVLFPAFFFFCYQYPKKIKMIITERSFYYFGIFFLYILIHAAFIPSPDEIASKTFRDTLQTVAFFASVVTVCTFALEKTLHKGVRFIGISAGVAAFISIAIYFIYPPVDPRIIPLGRTDTQVLAAFVYVEGMVCAFVALLNLKKEFLPYQRCWQYGLCISILTIAICVILTQSRMALACMLLTLAVGLLLLFLRLKPVHRLLILLVALIISGILTYIFAVPIHDYIHGLLQRGDSFRLELWQLTWQKILEYPWIGNGMNAIIIHPQVNSPHNIYLSAWFMLGIPGFVLFMAAIFALLIRYLQELRHYHYYALLAGLLLLNCLASGFIDHSRMVKGASALWIVFWLPLGVTLGFLIRTRYSKENL